MPNLPKNYNDWSELEVGCDVRRNPDGDTLEIDTNDEAGRIGTEIRLHPTVARRLRDWLIAAYPVGEQGT